STTHAQWSESDATGTVLVPSTPLVCTTGRNPTPLRGFGLDADRPARAGRRGVIAPFGDASSAARCPCSAQRPAVRMDLVDHGGDGFRRGELRNPVAEIEDMAVSRRGPAIA